ncbi:DUF4194 domain-containing protein [Williamsia sterculiae]|uniref:DUF4194 domain-containing protein n=1 Tax=Williamsia sterculiae TaxID=1344003 RepID=A0A1N7H958_9NOCA|nr:DUF4194 domain-containing protein [Williamsia sterculiae]SIS21399.1 protein of unknown function [Williamsia sterculiae]
MTDPRDIDPAAAAAAADAANVEGLIPVDDITDNASVDLSHFTFDDSTPVGTLGEEREAAPRFDGDTSQLPAPVCYALQELVAAAHVSGRSRNWRTVEAHEEIIRSRLSELNLVLVLDHENRYAFTRQVSENDPRQRNILRSATLTLAGSVLALFLRQKYLTSVDDPVTVERDEMVDHLLGYKPTDDTDEAGFVRRVDAAINLLESRKVIRQIAGTQRYAVFGVIAALLTPEQVQAHTDAYLALAGRGAGVDLDEVDDAAEAATEPDPTEEVVR